MVDRRSLIDSPERRSVPAALEFRSVGDGSLTLTGYASVFGNDYDVYGGPPFGWTESVDPGAFKTTLSQKPDLHLLINHEGMPLARTKSGTLQLSTDTHGLHVEANLDRNDPDVQRLQTKMQRGDMDEMSFGFRVKKDEWNDDETARKLTEVSLHKGDVSVVNFGANPATSAQVRSMGQALAFLAELAPEAALAEIRSGNPALFIAVREKLVGLSVDLPAPLPKEARKSMSLAEARAQLEEIAD